MFDSLLNLIIMNFLFKRIICFYKKVLVFQNFLFFIIIINVLCLSNSYIISYTFISTHKVFIVFIVHSSAIFLRCFAFLFVVCNINILSNNNCLI